MIQRISEDMVWSQIVARAWCDEGIMKRLMSEPRNVLAEHGLEVPPGIEVKVEEGTEVKVVEEQGTVRHFVLPVSPPDELTDEDLAGGAVAWYSGASGRCGACGCRCW
jgi:hypothetical protein